MNRRRFFGALLALPAALVERPVYGFDFGAAPVSCIAYPKTWVTMSIRADSQDERWLIRTDYNRRGEVTMVTRFYGQIDDIEGR